MLDLAKLEHAIDLQRRSYRLLRWMADAVTKNLIQFETAHQFSSLPDAASEWMLEHMQNLPPDARPAENDVSTFAKFFSTYLENSFDLSSNPGKQRFSPDAHCFCPMCSWLIDSPNLTPKKLTSSDKRRANGMRADAIQEVAAEMKKVISDEKVKELLTVDANYENASLLAYGHDLFRRTQGISNGPAVLALWRGFAWHRTGSPKRNFRLTSELILDAEAAIVELLKQN